MSSDDVLAIRKEGEPVNSIGEQANRLTETLGQAFISHRITPGDCRRSVVKTLKTARQEALRKAAKVAQRIIDADWENGQITLSNEIVEALDRLASEGG